jgi:hypothetical protein
VLPAFRGSQEYRHGFNRERTSALRSTPTNRPRPNRMFVVSLVVSSPGYLATSSGVSGYAKIVCSVTQKVWEEWVSGVSSWGNWRFIPASLAYLALHGISTTGFGTAVKGCLHDGDGERVWNVARGRNGETELKGLGRDWVSERKRCPN